MSDNLPEKIIKKGITPSPKEMTCAVFGLEEDDVKEIMKVNNIVRSKHGMFASVPIICKGENCIYRDVCSIDPDKIKDGSRCLMEVATILARYDQWCKYFEINTDVDDIDAQYLVDATLVRDLVNVEVQMMRAENKIALNGDFMSETLMDIDRKCNPYYEEIISPASEYLLKLNDRKIKILNQLNATRKDKASDKNKLAATSMAIQLFQKAKDMNVKENVNISDMNFEEIEPEEEVILIEGTVEE